MFCLMECLICSLSIQCNPGDLRVLRKGTTLYRSESQLSSLPQRHEALLNVSDPLQPTAQKASKLTAVTIFSRIQVKFFIKISKSMWSDLYSKATYIMQLTSTKQNCAKLTFGLVPNERYMSLFVAQFPHACSFCFALNKLI